MIKIDQVTRTYDGFTAVDGVSVDIADGEIVGLLGHNGAGKTTLLKMLTGFLEPSSGAIQVNGIDNQERRIEVQSLIGYLPENCPTYPEMTVAAYLDYAACLHAVPPAKRPERIRYALEQTELMDRALDQISTLSRGLRQRVGVAQAILHEPRIMILDEPTNGLDPTQIQHMRGLIKRLAENATIIISTHILQEVQAICDRVIIIRNGRKALDARIDELQSGHRLILSTDASSDRLPGLLPDPDIAFEVLSVTDANPALVDYALTFPDPTTAEQQAPAVAESVIKGGARLFGLRLEQRNLETIFGEITAQREVIEV